ncbi:hypothetical protein D9M69_426920 [compost metagenome]
MLDAEHRTKLVAARCRRTGSDSAATTDRHGQLAPVINEASREIGGGPLGEGVSTAQGREPCLVGTMVESQVVDLPREIEGGRDVVGQARIVELAMGRGAALIVPEGTTDAELRLGQDHVAAKVQAVIPEAAVHQPPCRTRAPAQGIICCCQAPPACVIPQHH